MKDQTQSFVDPFFIEFHLSQEDTDRITSCLVKNIGIFVTLKNGKKVTEEYFRSCISDYISSMMEDGYSTENIVELLCKGQRPLLNAEH